MRFPDRPFMKRAFDLVTNKGLTGIKLIPCAVDKVEYPNTWLFYNDAPAHGQDSSDDPFKVKSCLIDKSLATPQGVSDKVAGLLQPHGPRNSFRPLPAGQPRDIATAMAELLKDTNKFSTRNYMLEQDVWGLWGKTEYLGENFDPKLVESNHKLIDRHLVISLYKDGIKF